MKPSGVFQRRRQLASAFRWTWMLGDLATVVDTVDVLWT